MSKLTIINRPSFKSQNRYILAFGSYGHTVLMAFADNLEDAVDECIDWCAENAPGLLCTDYVNEEFKRLLDEGKGDDMAWEEACIDTICGGNAGDYVHSLELNLVAENPSRQTIKSFEVSQ